jgi:hypothetical protein
MFLSYLGCHGMPIRRPGPTLFCEKLCRRFVAKGHPSWAAKRLLSPFMHSISAQWRNPMAAICTRLQASADMLLPPIGVFADDLVLLGLADRSHVGRDATVTAAAWSDCDAEVAYIVADRDWDL